MNYKYLVIAEVLKKEFLIGFFDTQEEAEKIYNGLPCFHAYRHTNGHSGAFKSHHWHYHRAES